MAELVVRCLSAGYGEGTIISGADFSVRKGTISTIIGSNGAGKTTLLRTIAGLLRAKGGSVLLDGEDITNAPPHERVEAGLCLVPEGRKLFPYMSVEENLLMGSLVGRARKHVGSVMEQVYALFPRLKERRRQLAGTLSGGEQQMLAIGRGLMSCPKVMMLDEPSLGLAPNVVAMLFRLITDINKAGVTILLVEQNAKRALEVAENAFVLEQGKIVMRGTGEALLRDPQVKKAYLGV